MILNNIKNQKPAVTQGAVVITGASTGIGKAAALMLDNLGFDVYAGVRKEADGAALATAASSRLTPVMLDVTKSEQIATVMEEVSEKVSEDGIAGLVNNAGIAVAGPLEFLSLDDIRWQFEVNVLGVVAVTQAFAPLLRIAKGRIVNISSIAGRFAAPFLGPYAASKHALEAISDALRIELSPWDIKVSLIEPGEVDTPIWDKSLAAGKKMMAKLPAEAVDYYGPAIDMMFEVAENATGIPADEVAQAIIHALTGTNPKARYLLGRDAKMTAMVGRLPVSFRDKVVKSQMPAYGPQ